MALTNATQEELRRAKLKSPALSEEEEETASKAEAEEEEAVVRASPASFMAPLISCCAEEAAERESITSFRETAFSLNVFKSFDTKTNVLPEKIPEGGEETEEEAEE